MKFEIVTEPTSLNDKELKIWTAYNQALHRQFFSLTTLGLSLPSLTAAWLVNPDIALNVLFTVNLSPVVFLSLILLQQSRRQFNSALNMIQNIENNAVPNNIVVHQSQPTSPTI